MPEAKFLRHLDLATDGAVRIQLNAIRVAGALGDFLGEALGARPELRVLSEEEAEPEDAFLCLRMCDGQNRAEPDDRSCSSETSKHRRILCDSRAVLKRLRLKEH